MGRLGKYIDEMCRTQPEAMQRFLGMQIGRYSAWHTCLVGNIRAARGLNHYPEFGSVGGCVYDQQTGVQATRLAFWVGSKKLRLPTRFMPRQVVLTTSEDGQRFMSIMDTGSPVITALVKRRIVRRLGVAAPPVVLPEHVGYAATFLRVRQSRREVALAVGFEEPLVWHASQYQDPVAPTELTFSG